MPGQPLGYGQGCASKRRPVSERPPYVLSNADRPIADTVTTCSGRDRKANTRHAFRWRSVQTCSHPFAARRQTPRALLQCAAPVACGYAAGGFAGCRGPQDPRPRKLLSVRSQAAGVRRAGPIFVTVVASDQDATRRTLVHADRVCIGHETGTPDGEAIRPLRKQRRRLFRQHCLLG